MFLLVVVCYSDSPRVEEVGIISLQHCNNPMLPHKQFFLVGKHYNLFLYNLHYHSSSLSGAQTIWVDEWYNNKEHLSTVGSLFMFDDWPWDATAALFVATEIRGNIRRLGGVEGIGNWWPGGPFQWLRPLVLDKHTTINERTRGWGLKRPGDGVATSFFEGDFGRILNYFKSNSKFLRDWGTNLPFW